MNVWHFQFSDGEGIYHYDDKNPQHDLRSIFRKTKENAARMPLPQNDKVLMDNIRHKAEAAMKKTISDNELFWYSSIAFRAARYGFNDVTQVYKWFTPSELETMEKYPVSVAQYSLPDSAVIAGESQCLFLTGDAKPCDSMPVKKFLSEYPPS
jgi:hypothetical protein